MDVLRSYFSTIKPTTKVRPVCKAPIPKPIGILNEFDEKELFLQKYVLNWGQLNEWNKNFVKMPVSEIFLLLIARDSLQIKGLIELMFKVVAL